MFRKHKKREYQIGMSKRIWLFILLIVCISCSRQYIDVDDDDASIGNKISASSSYVSVDYASITLDYISYDLSMVQVRRDTQSTHQQYMMVT